MAGSKIGGLKAAAANKKRFGEDYYAQIGQRGGKAQVPKGFAKNIPLARVAGAKGGRNSKRAGKGLPANVEPKAKSFFERVKKALDS